jgi:hypothetical protein
MQIVHIHWVRRLISSSQEARKSRFACRLATTRISLSKFSDQKSLPPWM